MRRLSAVLLVTRTLNVYTRPGSYRVNSTPGGVTTRASVVCPPRDPCLMGRVLVVEYEECARPRKSADS